MQQETEGKGDVAKPGLMVSGALYSNRIIPCEPAPDTSDMVAGETTVIIHELEGGETSFNAPVYNRCNAIICEAMRMLETWKYIPVRVSRSTIPFDCIGLRADGALVLHVVRARKPVPDAKTAYRLYKKEVDYLRMMGTCAQFRKMIWVYSPQCRWRLYDIYPGGLRLALDLMEPAEK